MVLFCSRIEQEPNASCELQSCIRFVFDSTNIRIAEITLRVILCGFVFRLGYQVLAQLGQNGHHKVKINDFLSSGVFNILIRGNMFTYIPGSNNVNSF